MENRETVLITGGGGGIGLELARIFHARGYNLLIVSLLKEELERLKEELVPLDHDHTIITIQQDLSEQDSAFRIFSYCEKEGIEVDILVNNAGIGIYGRHVDIDPVDIKVMLNLNVVAATEFATLFGAAMKKRKRGKILITASTASFQPLPMMASYAATKSYLLNFARALKREMSPFGVDVSCLCPGTTRTNFLKQAGIAGDQKKSSFGSIAHRMQGDPVAVARDGYRGLMSGKGEIVPGFINKMHVSIVSITPGRLASFVAHMIFRRGYSQNESSRGLRN